MLFECIRSEGLAHNSWVIGDGREAAVIDPRRDCEVYLELTGRAGMRIAHVLETHRNEDYLVGSRELAQRSEAEVWHADEQLEYLYGEPAQDGQTFRVGQLTLTAIHTPGHTPGAMSYLLHDSSGGPWALFSGDTLFAGDVGRMDFLGADRLAEMAALMHDTIWNKILRLDDGVLLCPAHGKGSACGGAIADRVWTTIGIERARNPRLRVKDREEFLALAAMLEHPPYFSRMEENNLMPALLGPLPRPTPLAAEEFAERARYSYVLDTRMELGFGAAHVPGAFGIWAAGVPLYAGWFIPYDRPLLLVTDGAGAEPVVRYLVRMGYDILEGVLAGGMLSWHEAGLPSESVATETVQELCARLDAGEEILVLDVRSAHEVAGQRIPGARHLALTRLPEQWPEIPRDVPVAVFCGTGLRSMVAASFLRRQGYANLTVVLGGIMGWNSRRCPLS